MSLRVQEFMDEFMSSFMDGFMSSFFTEFLRKGVSVMCFGFGLIFRVLIKPAIFDEF